MAGRLEGFGDIVFGFAVSQCALQLPVERGHVDIANPVALLLYFGTFAVLASLWLIYHRMMSGTFKPSGVDLFISFAFLALVGLMPFALYEITHDLKSAQSARDALRGYLTLYAGMAALSTLLTFRNIRRGYFFMSGEERDRTWRMLVRQSVICAIMLCALGIDTLAGAAPAGLFLFSLIVAIRIVRKLFPRMPDAARLGIEPSAP